MSDKNIDKDIEILKKVQGIFEHLKTHGWINDIKRDVDTDTVILSIENVLSELETYKKIAEKEAEYIEEKMLIKISTKEDILEHFRKEVEK